MLLEVERGVTVAKKKSSKSRARRPGAKRRMAYPTLPQGDVGPDTTPGSAQMERADIVPMHGKGGDWRFKRRLHRLDIMARQKDSKGHPMISRAQRDAGMELLNRHEACQRTGEPAWFRPFVQASPKPGDMDVKRLEAEADYKALERVVPRHCLAVVLHVVIRQRTIRPGLTTDEDRAVWWLARLREGLDALRRELRL